MRFAFTEEQLEMHDAVVSTLAETCPATRVRAAWDTPDAALRAELAELGLLALNLPESAGGLGLGPVSWVKLLEATGRYAVPTPLVETLATNPVLAQLGEHDLAAGVATGDAFVTLLAEDGYALDADRADLILTTVDGKVATVSAATLTPQQSVDGTRRLFAVDGEVSVTDLDAGPLLDRAALAAAAQLLGLAGAMVDTAVDYAKARRQFGRPIGAFQAVQHHLVDATLKLRFAVPGVHHAAWCMETGHPEASVSVSVAKAYASEAADLAARKALQVHGAIGYTFEHDLHLWMKRAWTLASAWGDPTTHLDRVADHILED